ncbi:HD-GYP domain-containing protein [Sporomusa acidovorans]|uniref:HD-GYP domain-containing protein n=1 Tax=Sporomusa acidovorans (strain ATCC 49682 / DSM 3132 / Mol) TaxID=1123286 RepID=A0ABZ3J055_SPOA4|nr:HD-GYP domain-containing protein [Sporomusa acidovorans]OZC22779.1 cyclic di-GMP phosphodiesterase response regulator RpfG [Sporomusa acidovorans DSM 3132]SDE50655.1 HD-GYP domain, c-di-GMP phosphodiesterase class II (or its inactivated variant) [Sporomusa acidovorans]
MKKTILDLSKLVPGMILAETVLSARKQVILEKDTELTSHLINLLRKWKITSVCVLASHTTRPPSYHDVMFPSLVSGYSNKLEDKYHKISITAGSIFEYMRDQEQLPFDTLRQLAFHDLYNFIDDNTTLTFLYQAKPPLEYTYLHAVDVGIITGLIARWCGFKEKTVQSLILAGLMHDIGKSQIPRSILDKPGQPTVEEKAILKLHPIYGYYMVKSLNHIPSAIQYAILQHHERENGSGYPGGLPSHKIHPFAKIIAIADTYDAMTSNRVYRHSITPFAALEIMANEIFIHFDRDYCKLFIRNAISALTGSTVLLSDETQAEVLHFGSFMSIKPAVRRLDGTLLDLNNSDISIVEVVKFA